METTKLLRCCMKSLQVIMMTASMSLYQPRLALASRWSALTVPGRRRMRYKDLTSGARQLR